ncbi:hypothetical protein MRB53_038516 [Persea americana]|nr:hypothetical protein MRB53_038516 [Persea americana]
MSVRAPTCSMIGYSSRNLVWMPLSDGLGGEEEGTGQSLLADAVCSVCSHVDQCRKMCYAGELQGTAIVIYCIVKYVAQSLGLSYDYEPSWDSTVFLVMLASFLNHSPHFVRPEQVPTTCQDFSGFNQFEGYELANVHDNNCNMP